MRLRTVSLETENYMRIANPSILRRAALATVLLVGSYVFSCAQSKTTSSDTPQNPTAPLTQIQVDNAESTSKPDDVQIPEANPARPTVTNPAHIPPVGYLQFEQGLVEARPRPTA